MTFKDRLREEIEYKGLQIKELSAAAGVNNNTFLSYIDSRGYMPSAETAVKIAKVLGVSVEYLVTGEDSDCAHNSKHSDIQEIVKDLANLDKSQLVTVKKMVHGLV